MRWDGSREVLGWLESFSGRLRSQLRRAWDSGGHTPGQGVLWQGGGLSQGRLSTGGVEGLRLDDLMRVFNDEGWGGQLSFTDFDRAIRRLLLLHNGQEGKAMVEHLFRLFDVNHNGAIDWR